MNRFNRIAIAAAACCAAHAALAAPILIATGSLSASQPDLSTQTAGALENGVAGNLFGGIGSGLAYAGGGTFIAVPDRGPNATAYNPLVDDTSSYIARFQTLRLALTPNGGAGLPYVLTPTLAATTLLSSPTPLVYGSGALGTGMSGGVPYTLGSGVPSLNAVNGTSYFTGRSDGFDATKPSTNPNNARLDPEAVRVAKDGKSVFISDEYGPYVYQFDRATGARIRAYALPGNLAITNLSAVGATEISGNTIGRVANKGMEGLAITPDGRTLVGIIQAPLEQDAAKNLRIVTIDVATGATHEYAYLLTTGTGVSEIVALNDHQFLVDERDGKGLGDSTVAVVKQIFKIDITGAQDVTALSGDLASKAVPKQLLIDVVAVLNANGITGKLIPAKLEGLAFGDDVVVGGVTEHTLFLANDNDFLSTVNVSGGGTARNDNQFFVFGVSDADLARVGATFDAGAFAIPEPSSGPLVLGALALMGLAAIRRR